MARPMADHSRAVLLAVGDLLGREVALDELLSPERLATVPGHTFGTELTASERRLLADYVASLGDPAGR